MPEVKRSNIIAIVFLCILAVFLYHSLFDLSYWLQDSFKLLAASQVPGRLSWDYTQHILLSPTNGPQYRPLSYFYWFQWQRYLFGLDVWKFQLTGFVIFILSAAALFAWLKIETRQTFAALFGAAIFLLCPWNYYFLTVPTYSFKYYFPLLVFFLYMSRILKDRGVTRLVWQLLFVFLFLLSIATHEASFLLPFLALFLLFLDYGFKLGANNLLVTLPSLIYLFARLFYFDVPHDGFMKVDYSFPLQALPSFIGGGLWRLLSRQSLGDISSLNIFIAGAYFLSILIATVLFKKYRYQFIKAFLLTVVPILPFSLLQNHFLLDRGAWAYIGFSYFFAVVFVAVKSLNSFRLKIAMSVVACVFFVNAFYQNQLSGKGTYQSVQRRGEPQKRLVEELKEQFSGIREGSTIELLIPALDSWQRYDIFPGLLALYFPQYRFKIITKGDSQNYSIATSGYFFHCNGGEQKMDPFGYVSKIEDPIEEPDVKIELDKLPAVFF